MGVAAISPVLRRAKYVVGKSLRKFGIQYSAAASAQMWRERADAFAAQGRMDEALNCRRKAAELAPSSKVGRQQENARGRGIPAIMFVAMMKSASEFIRENLIRALDVPEIELSVGTVPRDQVIPSAVRQLAKGGAIARSHLSANNLPVLAANGVDRLILHVRDPRQVVVSWVHHMRRISDMQFRWAVFHYDPPVPAEFRRWEFRRQLDWAVYNYLPGQLQWLEDWAAALDEVAPTPVLVSTFEDFAHDQRAFFGKISDFLGVAEIRVPGAHRQSAAAMRNFRSGHVDEWRGALTDTHIDFAAARVEPLAKRFGWKL
jgi:hypothetical protein